MFKFKTVSNNNIRYRFNRKTKIRCCICKKKIKGTVFYFKGFNCCSGKCVQKFDTNYRNGNINNIAGYDHKFYFNVVIKDESRNNNYIRCPIIVLPDIRPVITVSSFNKL